MAMGVFRTVRRRDSEVNFMEARKEKGFSLLEVMVAITLLTFGILAVASMQVSAIKGNALSRDLTKASSLARGKVEELMLAGYNDPAVADADGDGTNQDADDDGLDDDGGNFGLEHDTAAEADGNDSETSSSGIVYRLFWNVAEDEPLNGAKKIRVIVTWTERGAGKRVSMDFIKSDI